MSSTAQLSQDLMVVGLSWTQKNRERFAFSKMPRTRTRSSTDMVYQVTYNLPDLANALQSKGLDDFDHGDSQTERVPLKKSPKTISLRRRATKRHARPMGSTAQVAYKDLESNLPPMCLSKLYQGVTVDVMAAMTSTDNFGAAKEFTTGASKSIDDPTDYANQKPDININQELRALRPYADGTEFMLECHLDEEVLLVLARHPAYTGAGTGSAIASQLTPEEAVARIKSVHMLDAVHVYKSVYNSAALGQTADVTSITNGLLFFGVFDRRSAEFNITNADDALMVPDGCLCVAIGRDAEVFFWQEPEEEQEYFQGRMSFAVFSPRGSTHGFFYKSSGEHGIFTTLP